MSLKKLSNRKLNLLQHRLSKIYWREVDCFPAKKNEAKVRRVDAALTRIGSERLRRLCL